MLWRKRSRQDEVGGVEVLVEQMRLFFQSSLLELKSLEFAGLLSNDIQYCTKDRWANYWPLPSGIAMAP